MKKLLFLCPHLSTGGMPQYVLYCVKKYISDHDIYVIEYNNISDTYVVQKNKIRGLLPKDHLITLSGTLDEKHNKLISIIDDIKPDMISNQDFPEIWLREKKILKETINWLYRSDRPYFIEETSHSSQFKVEEKKWLPDGFAFISEYFQNYYKQLVDLVQMSRVEEYILERKEKPNRKGALEKLKLNPDFLHVLNVGLFTPWKNQKEIIEIAKGLTHYPIKFHFIGNTAPNFMDYWKPLIDNLPSNCVIWGEQPDVDIFYSAMDLLLFTSKMEANPLVPKEAISWGMPCLMYNLPTYNGVYDKEELVTYLTGDIICDIENLIKELKHLNVTPMEEKFLPYKRISHHFVLKPHVSFDAIGKGNYSILFIDNDTGEILYEGLHKVDSKNWLNYHSTVFFQYFINWKIVIMKDDEIIFSKIMDLKDKKVYIEIGSKALGDLIAWIPYVEEFRKKHNCFVYLGGPDKYFNLFEKEYPEICFLKEKQEYHNVLAGYYIGIAEDDPRRRTKKSWRLMSLQELAATILGLEYKEIKPKIHIESEKFKSEKKYVCLSEFSTLNCKLWNYPNGWQEVVDYINSKGYEVRSISLEETSLMNVKKHNGRSMKDTISVLLGAEFFIGVGSGLSWLAWALNIPVIMISGFSKPFAEFHSGLIRIHNDEVCNGCYNDPTLPFIKNNKMWCPRGKDFECTRKITPGGVMGAIDLLMTENK